MSSKQMAPVTAGFEALKLTNEHNAEYWSARDLQPLLGYSQWRRFEHAVERAMASCEASGNEAQYHFAGAGKPITGGKGAVQVVDDYHLSRFACFQLEGVLRNERLNLAGESAAPVSTRAWGDSP
jgi:DNA-damage-inducible protein D